MIMQVLREEMSRLIVKKKGVSISIIANAITTMFRVIEECFRKIENEELLRIFRINTVIGAQKSTKQKKSHWLKVCE